MAVRYCLVRGYEGYQAQWKGKRKYFACLKYGKWEARKLAAQWEKQQKKTNPIDPSSLSRYKDDFVAPHLKLKWLQNGINATAYVQTWIPKLVRYRMCSISKYGLEEAVARINSVRRFHCLETCDNKLAVQLFTAKLNEYNQDATM
jgi:hypothetical protein